MQSFLQYRRFGKHVEAQYERDRSKAEALGNADASESWSPSSSNTAQDDANIRDPEKGDQPNMANETTNAQDHAALESEETEEQSGGGYEPIRATPSGREGSIAGEEAEHMSRASTVPTKRSMGTALGTTLTGIAVRDRSTKEGGEGKVFVVGYEGENDSMNPHNWSRATRFAAT